MPKSVARFVQARHACNTAPVRLRIVALCVALLLSEFCFLGRGDTNLVVCKASVALSWQAAHTCRQQRNVRDTHAIGQSKLAWQEILNVETCGAVYRNQRTITASWNCSFARGVRLQV